MTIQTLASGETVSAEAGAYSTPIEHYHSQAICPGPSISSSGLRMIANESPWHFWAQFEGNPNRFPPEPNDAFDFGRAAHTLLLGEEGFNEMFAIRPVRFKNYQTSAAKEWRETVRAAGQTPITRQDLIHIMHMAESLQRMPLAVEALRSDMTEISMIWQDRTGVWLKSRPDTIPSNGMDFADLKTTTDASTFAVQRSITKFGYAQQMALAIEGAEHCFGDRSATDCLLVFVEKAPPYAVALVQLDEEALYQARCINRGAIDTFAKCLETGEWPMPVDGILPYTPPPSISQRFYERQGAGEIPNIERAE